MKRTERHHLKEDQFATGLQRFFHFVEGHRLWLVVAVAALVLGVLIFLGVRLLRVKGLERQGRVEAQILELYKGLDKGADNAAKLEAWTEKGRQGRLASLLLGTHWMSKGNLERAEAVLSKVPDSPKDIVYFQVQDLLAQVYFQRKDYDKAIEVDKAIQAANPKDFPLDVSIFRQAEALQKKGQKAEALALYKKVQEEYVEGPFGYQASQKVRELE